jgi:hypothetical protein
MSQPLGQSRRASLLEAFANILIGFLISSLANLLFLPLWGFHVSLSTSLEIGLLFTLISLLRSYLLRRLFNAIHIARWRG